MSTNRKTAIALAIALVVIGLLYVSQIFVGGGT